MLRLSWAERALLLEALLTVGAVRLGLTLLPFGALRWLLRRATTPRPQPIPRPIEPALWAVRASARRVPRASCLTQALAAQVLLARRGHAAELRLGVAGREGALRAHAWLELGGVVLLGEHEPGRYAQLPLPRGRL